MFHEIERELSNGEPWSVGYPLKLPRHLQSLVEQQQGRQDVWELPTKEPKKILLRASCDKISDILLAIRPKIKKPQPVADKRR
jgi:hypothetical protein